MKGPDTWTGGGGDGRGGAGRRQRGRRHKLRVDEEGENGMRRRGMAGGDGKGQRDAMMSSLNSFFSGSVSIWKEN